MSRPTPAQSRLLDQIVQVSEGLAAVLREQFDACLTAPTEGCGECFDVSVPSASSRLPPGTDNPLAFNARASERPGPTLVLLWLEEGRVSYVEVSDYSGSDEHPPIQDLTIEAILREEES